MDLNHKSHYHSMLYIFNEVRVKPPDPFYIKMLNESHLYFFLTDLMANYRGTVYKFIKVSVPVVKRMEQVEFTNTLQNRPVEVFVRKSIWLDSQTCLKQERTHRAGCAQKRASATFWTDLGIHCVGVLCPVVGYFFLSVLIVFYATVNYSVTVFCKVLNIKITCCDAAERQRPDMMRFNKTRED